MRSGWSKFYEDNWIVMWRDDKGHILRQGKRLAAKSSWEHQIAARIYVLKDFIHSVKFIKNELGLPLREALEICKAWRGETKHY